MKKKLITILTICCMLFACLGVIGCGDSGNTSGGNTANAQIMAIYNSYLASAQEKGVSPLSYDEWLATIKGEKGEPGKDGIDGKSAYQIWIENGYTGTQADFLNWLKGQRGDQGIQGEKGDQGEQGVGIADMYISNDGYLMVKYTNSSEYVNLGKVVPDVTIDDGNGLEFCISTDGTGYAVKDIGEYFGKDVVIPSTYRGIPVVEIYDNAFSGYTITSVTIPNSVTKIGEYAFASCSLLKNVEIPKSITVIGYAAFYECNALETFIYSGTLEEWKNINKIDGWISNVVIDIQCSNGATNPEHTCTYSVVYTSIDDYYHKSKCTTCKKEIVEEHNWVAGVVDGNGNPTENCSKCGALKHTCVSGKVFTRIDNNYHKSKCTVCKKEIVEEHNWVEGIVDGNGDLTYNCSKCGTLKDR